MDVEGFSRLMEALTLRYLHMTAWVSRRAGKRPRELLSEVPFVSLSVLVVLVALFAMSMVRGGWSWSTWIYSFAFSIMVPLVAFEVMRGS